jgi:large subunit ribosomal protein L10
MPKTKEQKTKDLDALKADLNDSQAVVIADYRGLSVNQMNELRDKLAEAGAKMAITKNSLLNKANKNIVTEGPSAVVFGFDKVVEPVKVIYDYAKKTELPVVKLGLLNGEVIDETQVKALSTMPSLDELRAKLIGSMNAPVSGFVQVSGGVVGAFTRVVNAYKESKE